MISHACASRSLIGCLTPEFSCERAGLELWMRWERCALVSGNATLDGIRDHAVRVGWSVIKNGSERGNAVEPDHPRIVQWIANPRVRDGDAARSVECHLQ